MISDYLGHFPFLSLILCSLTSVHTSNPPFYFSYFHCIDHGLCYPCGQLDISFLGGQKSNLSVLEFSMNKCKWPRPWLYMEVQKKKKILSCFGEVIQALLRREAFFPDLDSQANKRNSLNSCISHSWIHIFCTAETRGEVFTFLLLTSLFHCVLLAPILEMLKLLNYRIKCFALPSVYERNWK